MCLFQIIPVILKQLLCLIINSLLQLDQYSPFHLTLILLLLFWSIFLHFSINYLIIVYSQFFFEWHIYHLVNRLASSGLVPVCSFHLSSFPQGPCLHFLTSTPPTSAAEPPAKMICAELHTASLSGPGKAKCFTPVSPRSIRGSLPWRGSSVVPQECLCPSSCRFLDCTWAGPPLFSPTQACFTVGLELPGRAVMGPGWCWTPALQPHHLYPVASGQCNQQRQCPIHPPGLPQLQCLITPNDSFLTELLDIDTHTFEQRECNTLKKCRVISLPRHLALNLMSLRET